MISIKVYEGSPKIIAVCDAEIIGKKFEDGRLQIDINETFFKGQIVDEFKAKKILAKALEDYASFNIVGERAVAMAIELGLIEKDKVLYIKNIPIALALV